MSWDWSQAGQLDENGKPLTITDENGHVIYSGLKGEFTLEENVVPEYVWFNGQVSYTLLSDKIDPSGVVGINQFLGDKDDPDARIWPVKRFTGIQPYDSGNNTLVVPHLFGKDETAYWGNFDWDKAIAAGMENADLKYSGEYDFVETEMYWPITHMVAPANEALQCAECHTTEESRLDFSALGYSDADVSRLTKFPPRPSKRAPRLNTHRKPAPTVTPLNTVCGWKACTAPRVLAAYLATNWKAMENIPSIPSQLNVHPKLVAPAT